MQAGTWHARMHARTHAHTRTAQAPLPLPLYPYPSLPLPLSHTHKHSHNTHMRQVMSLLDDFRRKHLAELQALTAVSGTSLGLGFISGR